MKMKTNGTTFLTDEWLEAARAQQAAANKAKRAGIPPGQKCSTCKHFRRHEFSSEYNYCANGKSSHTPNGLAKTTPTKWCAQWEERK